MIRKPTPPPKKAPAKTPAPRKPAQPKKAAKTKVPAKKAPAKRKGPGGAVSTSATRVTAGRGKAIPEDAVLLLSDAEYGAAVVDEMKSRLPAETVAQLFEDLVKNATFENKFGETRIDHKTRLAALEKYVHITVGKPLERIQNVQTTTYSYEELESLIAHSGELRRALRGMLAPFDEEDGR